MHHLRTLIIFAAIIAALAGQKAAAADEIIAESIQLVDVAMPVAPPDSVHIDMAPIVAMQPYMSKPGRISIYELPYSLTLNSYNWNRLWVNTAVLAGAYIGTLVVLECLPEDATSWNRSELQKDPPLKRWYQNVFKKGPEWDHDNAIFNYVLHPYAGAAYFMTARSCGFNFYRSLLYSACISTIGWEFGIEACMERPSIQDIFITPIVGSLIGESFYKAKRKIVDNGYTLAGSSTLGNIVVFLIDPVNEVTGLIWGNPCRERLKRRHVGSELSSSLVFRDNGSLNVGLSLRCTF